MRLPMRLPMLVQAPPMWVQAMMLVGALAAAGCSPRELLYDELDVGVLKTQFACAPGLTGDRAVACRMLDDFAAGEALAAWPAAGLETWYGPRICLDAIDATDRMAFVQVHLRPGLGTPLYPHDTKTDPARDVPYGAQFILTSAGSITPGAMIGYRATLEAAEKGTEAPIDALPPGEREHAQRHWANVKVPPGTTEFYRLVKSKGPSVLGGPLTDDGPPGAPSATYFVRARGNRMLVVYPSWSSAMSPCVGEAWRIHAAP